MFRNANEVPRDQRIETDVCVVGAGAAGIALGEEFANSGRSVLFLESGDRKLSARTQSLYEGRIVPGGYLSPSSDYLTTSRLRLFGGTSTQWMGLCAPLSPIDLERREWIPNSGWPFDYAELKPYFDRAEMMLDVGPFDTALLARKPLEFGNGAGIESSVKQYSSYIHYGEVFAERLKLNKKAEVLLNANVTELHSNAAGSKIDWVRVKTLSGNTFKVAARCFVLAAGGIENVRLMLSSDSVHPDGMGNDNDLLGRYFMDHLFQLTDPGLLVLAVPEEALSLYERPELDPLVRRPTLGRFILSPELQRRHRLPHNAVGITKMPEPGRVPMMREVGSLAAGVSPEELPDSQFNMLGIDLEPVPDPENRVTLSDERDALGMRRVVLRWEVTQQDRENAVRFLEVFSNQLGQSLRGRTRVTLNLDYNWSRFISSAHHIGTTRMDDDSKRGVVDANCRVHGIGNLYVAGSSVFPSAGLVNPTFTIVAMSIRLADRLKEVLR